MKNTQPRIHQDKAQTPQLPKLQPLNLEHLDCVAGGSTYPCPDCPERDPERGIRRSSDG